MRSALDARLAAADALLATALAALAGDQFALLAIKWIIFDHLPLVVALCAEAGAPIASPARLRPKLSFNHAHAATPVIGKIV